MKIVADLSVSVSAPGRPEATGTLTADGQRLTLNTTDAVTSWQGATDALAAVPGGVGGVAGLLHDQGLTLEVTGPQGRVATLGAGVNSILGRLAVGSPHVQVGSVAAVLPLARAEAGGWLRKHPAVPAVVAAAVAFGWLRRRLR